MTVRRWQKGDNAEIAAIEKQSFADPWSEDMFDPFFLTDTFYGLVAVEDGRIAGYVGAVYIFETADVVNVCVEKSYRRRGIAKRLLSDLVRDLSGMGVTRFLLEVRRSNAPAIALYENCGFKKTGERKRYYEDTEDALIYELTT
ncbi:MAG: ribosomal protein S18-alanine N-acetyltransferase [Clostridia bacterium]|nr:ribosomal protein S18-alanine N-acetyltransferase [Clostridia bacterium]